MWGFMWGYLEKKPKPRQRNMAGFVEYLVSRGFLAYIKPSSIARLTAARRLLTLSLL
jgi:hypothetical protein